MQRLSDFIKRHVRNKEEKPFLTEFNRLWEAVLCGLYGVMQSLDENGILS